MSNKQALRDLQQRLAQRMQAALEQSQTKNWLAVECAGVGLLFSLNQAAEIFTPVSVQPVPYSKPWLVGVANLRGGLFTVVDLAVFLGLREGAGVRAISSQSRLVSLSADLNINCAVLVDRMVGLRSDEQLQLDAAPLGAEAVAPVRQRPRFAGPVWRDDAGLLWQQIDLEALARHDQFLRIIA